jgi:hypothetical protein
MLAVAAQLPAAVLADEASGEAAIAAIAHTADAAALALTMSPLFSSINEASIGTKHCAWPYKILKGWRAVVRPRCSHHLQFMPDARLRLLRKPRHVFGEDPRTAREVGGSH